MGTYRQIFYQIIFGTKNRKPTISKTNDEELYKYIGGIIKIVIFTELMALKIIFTSCPISIQLYA
jgi:hypothetical protein